MTAQTPLKPHGKVSSPCIGICEIDRKASLCRGCGRTLTEIASWLNFSEDQRKAIMAELPARLARRE